jgi:hypothetical protein
LGISSKDNPVRPGQKDCIKPDGLALRRDGALAIIEAKAVDDCDELVRATVQAFCGAVAVHAVRDWVRKTAAQNHGRRPAMIVRVPEVEPSLALYVMVDHRKYHQRGDGEFCGVLETLLRGWEPLREIVYFAVDAHAADFPARLPYDVSHWKAVDGRVVQGRYHLHVC